MALNELILNQVKPWLNARVQNLQIDGTLTPAGVGTAITPFMVGPSYQYKTIQSAINAAHAFFPSNDDPAIIYVYPDQYNENLSLYGGIHIVGLDNTAGDNLFFNLNSGFKPLYNGVQITGHHQILSGDATQGTAFNNITFFSDATSSILFTFTQVSNNENMLYFSDCKMLMQGVDSIFNSVANNIPQVNMDNVYIDVADSSPTSTFKFINFQSASTFLITMLNSQIFTSAAPGNAPIDMSGVSSGGLEFSAINCQLGLSFKGFNGSQTCFISVVDSFFTGSDSTSTGRPLTIFNTCDWNISMENCYDGNSLLFGFNNQLTQLFTGISSATVAVNNCYYPGVSNSGVYTGCTFTSLFINNLICSGSDVLNHNSVFWDNSPTIGALTTTNVVTLSGVISKPNQPLVIAYLSTSPTDVTGDGTVYTVIFDTSIADQASNYNTSTGVFTVPTAGIYRVSGCITVTGLTSSFVNMQGEIVGATSSNTFIFGVQNPGAMFSQVLGPSYLLVPFCALVKYSLNEQVSITISVGGSTKSIGLVGGAGLKDTYLNIEMVT
jgi:hypothetical protein